MAKVIQLIFVKKYYQARNIGVDEAEEKAPSGDGTAPGSMVPTGLSAPPPGQGGREAPQDSLDRSFSACYSTPVAPVI